MFSYIYTLYLHTVSTQLNINWFPAAAIVWIIIVQVIFIITVIANILFALPFMPAGKHVIAGTVETLGPLLAVCSCYSPYWDRLWGAIKVLLIMCIHLELSWKNTKTCVGIIACLQWFVKRFKNKAYCIMAIWPKDSSQLPVENWDTSFTQIPNFRQSLNN